MNSNREYANEVRRLATALKKINGKIDCGPLEELASRCTSLHNKYQHWHYRLTDMKFPLAPINEYKMRHSWPQIDEYQVVLSVEACGDYCARENLCDPIKHLSVNIEVVGRRAVAKDEEVVIQEMFCAWHLDSHPPKPAIRYPYDCPPLESDSGKNYPHPRYHLQFGGNAIHSKATSPDFFGSHLLFDSPRIPHPPLDVILAIDFVLGHYYGPMWYELRESADGMYSKTIKEAQRLYWRPYYASLYMPWNAEGSEAEWNPTLVQPFLGEKPMTPAAEVKVKKRV